MAVPCSSVEIPHPSSPRYHHRQGSQKIPKYVTTPKQPKPSACLLQPKPSARLLQPMGNGCSRATCSALPPPFTTCPKVRTGVFTTQIPALPISISLKNTSVRLCIGCSQAFLPLW
ncbi:hypothetical protein AV530_002178 [Patagioenas fasciata monilis]|uniref:Uncharacterized protein n=1 Tax=Patagioenas fasciata monilis TaxID=372326 RepID=A0A1V4K5G1_PATFA|nr:hypothetical protein AV530_002178 [Patagioenas fasciata monilis]